MQLWDRGCLSPQIWQPHVRGILGLVHVRNEAQGFKVFSDRDTITDSVQLLVLKLGNGDIANDPWSSKRDD